MIGALALFALAWDGEFLYVARPGGVDVYREGRRVAALGEELRSAVCLSARGRRLAEGGGRAGESGEVRVWEGGKLLWRAAPHEDLVYGLAWSEDGATLYAASGDRTIGVLDAATGALKGRLRGHTGPVLALAARGGRLVSGGADGTLRVWEDGRPARTISNHTGAVNALAFAPDGRLASGSADRTVRLWRIEEGRLLKIVRGHEGSVTGLAWQGDVLWSACADGKGRRIDAEAAAVVETLDRGADWLHAVEAAEGRVWFLPATGGLFGK